MKNPGTLFSPGNVILLLAGMIAAALVMPALFQDGMFADGILYASVSKNMANGAGSFWDAHFTAFMHDHFHEQPPLVFFMQSLFFRVFPGIYPERVYDLVFALIDSWLIVRLWQNIFAGEKNLRAYAGWPLFLFFISPVVFWAFTNNIIEITMAAFVLAAVNALVIALVHQKQTALQLVLAAGWIIGASLCKGPQGLFPLVVPAVLWLTMRNTVSFKKALTASLVLFGITAVFYVILLQFAVVREAYTEWYANRIVHTFSGTNNTTGTHFSMLYDLFLDLLPLLGVSLLIFLAGRKAAVPSGSARAWGHAVLLIALSGTLPLLITKEQRPFYLTTSMPFYALSIACYSAPVFAAFIGKALNRQLLWKILGIGSLVLTAGILVLTICLAGTAKRDADMLEDIRSITKIVGSGNEAGCNPEAYGRDAFVNYFKRYGNIDVNPNTTVVHSSFYITFEGNAPAEYRKVGLKTKVLSLYIKREPAK